MSNKKELFTAFIAAINQHDLIKLQDLLATEHELIHSINQKIKSKIAVLAFWNAHFKNFTDYSIKIDETSEIGEGILALGEIIGSWIGEKTLAKTFQIPIAIKINFDLSTVSFCQFYGDIVSSDKLFQTGSLAEPKDLSVRGIGGVFFKAKNPKMLCAWYDKHLGTTFRSQQYTYFRWRERENPMILGSTSFSFLDEKTNYNDPSEKPFMINLRVNNLDAFLSKLAKEGINNVGEIDKQDYGNFGWIMDPEGNKIELWEPKDSVLDDYEDQQGS